MTATEAYTRMHEAFRTLAVPYKVSPASMRVLIAIADLADGEAVLSSKVERALRDGGGSQVRRSLSELYRAGLADAGVRKRGVRSRIRLTTLGSEAALKFRALTETR